MRKMLFLAVCMAAAFSSYAQNDCQIAVFGALTDGVTDNTSTIQKAIDYVSAKGGGTISFSVGRYLTGAIELKDNVVLDLKEGAVLVSSSNIHSYKGHGALIYSSNATGVGIVGKGCIDGSSKALRASISDQMAKGYISSDAIPALVDLSGCADARVEGIKIINPAGASIVGVTPEGVYTYLYDEGKCITPSGKTIKLQK